MKCDDLPIVVPIGTSVSEVSCRNLSNKFSIVDLISCLCETLRRCLNALEDGAFTTSLGGEFQVILLDESISGEACVV